MENPLSPSVKEPPSLLAPTSRGFAFDAAFNTTGPSKFFLNTPGTITNLSGQTDFFAGSSWANGKWYAINYTAHQLVTCDTTTGANTVLGVVSPISGSTIGLAWNPVNSTMYLLTTSPNNLYTVNIATGAATLVAAITGVTTIIDGA